MSCRHQLKNSQIGEDEIATIFKESLSSGELNVVLRAVYKYQLKNGFILFDPTDKASRQEKEFYDPDTNITFKAQWNPNRELRKDNNLLIERGIIAKDTDQSKLINFDENGHACHLCHKNIETQGLKEILVEIKMAEETFFAGANFASFTNNHFTIMSENHEPQKYNHKVPIAMMDFLNQAGDDFRIIFNGLAGATIKEHLHFQTGTENLPIEDIKIEKENILYEKADLRTSTPNYYLPLWIVESKEKEKVADIIDDLLGQWHKINENNTENILITKNEEWFRVFVYLRDKRRLSGPGKKGDVATFESSGFFILSYSPKDKMSNDIDELKTFNDLNLKTFKKILLSVSPDQKGSKANSKKC